MLVSTLDARDFRSLERLEIELGPGITSIVGENGAGKTNLLEAVYFGLSGRSFRTRDRRELIRFGEKVARAELRIDAGEQGSHQILASVQRGEGRRHLLDGSAVQPAEIARHRPHLIVFSPDRLVLVKGPPAERRSHLDSFIAARWPTRTGLRQDYGKALAQRNALLRRVASGQAPESELDAWDSALVGAAVPLIEARAEATAELAPLFAEAAPQLGVEPAELRYAPRSDPDSEQLLAGLGERRSSDLARLRTSLGPHLDELEISLRDRSLRRYGSQGEQRAGLLALLFAERGALLGGEGSTPLMLLDDVMSELDPAHRELLSSHLAESGQTLISAADAEALPEPAARQLVRMPAASAAELSASRMRAVA
jgi:DNA replication and repair protein RecF